MSYIMKTYVGVEVQVQSFFISVVHIEVSAQFVAVGARGKDAKCEMY